MKLRFFFNIIFVVCFNISSFANNDLIDDNGCYCPIEYLDSLLTSTDLNTNLSLSDSQTYTTTLINALSDAISIQNNNIDLIAIIVAIIGVFLTFIGIIPVIVGYFGYKEFKKEVMRRISDFSSDIKDYKDVIKSDNREYEKIVNEDISRVKKEFQNEIEVINGIKNDVVDKEKDINNLTKKQEFQNQYLKRINEYLFSITNSIVDIRPKSKEEEDAIRKRLYNQYYIVKVFLPWSDSPTDGTEAAFMNLKIGGTEENLTDLQFIANNDFDEKKRKLAQETIGYIRARLMSGQAW